MYLGIYQNFTICYPLISKRFCRKKALSDARENELKNFVKTDLKRVDKVLLAGFLGKTTSYRARIPSNKSYDLLAVASLSSCF